MLNNPKQKKNPTLYFALPTLYLPQHNTGKHKASFDFVRTRHVTLTVTRIVTVTVTSLLTTVREHWKTSSNRFDEIL